MLDAPCFKRNFCRAQQCLAQIAVVVGTSRRLHLEEPTMLSKKFTEYCHWLQCCQCLHGQDMKLTENTILLTGIGRGPAEAFHTLVHNVIIAGLREKVSSHGGRSS